MGHFDGILRLREWALTSRTPRGVPVNAPHEGVLGMHPVMGERGREGRGEKKREGERSEGRERKGKREGAARGERRKERGNGYPQKGGKTPGNLI